MDHKHIYSGDRVIWNNNSICELLIDFIKSPSAELFDKVHTALNKLNAPVSDIVVYLRLLVMACNDNLDIINNAVDKMSILDRSDIKEYVEKLERMESN